MENDPNKKESKGKRLLKKALRRNSKSSNSSQGSSLDQSINVSRSKSFENKQESLEINDSAPLPTPDGTKEKSEAVAAQRLKEERAPPRPPERSADDKKAKKMVDIQESRNEVFEEAAAASKSDANATSSLKLGNTERLPQPESSKKGLKRKLEDESGAGTSGASTTSDTDADDKDPSKDKKKKNRCAVCRKKVGLTGFECRCGGLFCAVHRYSDKHDCSFDYRELGAQEIRRNNPVVVSQKIHKI